ncbi:MAG: hypothetical protein IJ311_03120 [Elusimicrobiaceae bacterium]|nr:hypothetical protein [Elusimicrobiaceae bacterium]
MKNTVINLAEHMTEDKPYNKCIACPNLGVRCDGPNFLAMSGERWVEWCKIRKDYLKWSNQYLSDISGISKPTVDRILSGHGGDIRNSTMEAITKALVNGTWGQFPCADPNPSAHDPDQHKETEMLRGEKDYLKRIVDDLQNSIKWYKGSLKLHKWVIVILGIIVFLAVVAIIVDLAIGDIGWIRY